MLQVEHLALETDTAVEISVVRRGNGEGKIKCTYKTENVSVLPESYQELEGEVVMDNGVMTATIQIDIIDNDSWNIEAQTLVHLLEPTNCVLVTPICRGSLLRWLSPG